jgi:hypothetical protein
MGDLHHDRSLVGHGHRESGKPRFTPVSPHLGALGTQRDQQRVGEPCHLGGVRREQVHILGRSIHQIVGKHRATSGQGTLPRLRQREGNPGDLLMQQQIEAHDTATPS